MNEKPTRVQLKRVKGWRLPSNTVVVSRPSPWGNPYRISETMTAQQAVDAFRLMLKEGRVSPFALANIREFLTGKNLACWCPRGQPCHADVLLEIANA